MTSRKITVLAFLSVANIAIQFSYHWYTITRVGSGWQTDALYAGLVVPVFVLSVVSTSLTHVLVPILTACREADFEDSVWFYLYSIGIVFLLLAGLLILTDGIWIPLILPGLSADAIELTRSVFEIQVFGILGVSLVAVLEAASHARLKFYNVEIARICAALFGLLILSFTIGEYGIYAAAIVYSLRPLFVAGLLIRHAGNWRRFSFDFAKGKAVWSRLRYLVAGSLYYRLDPLLDRYLLSSAIPGSITLYYLAQQIYGAGSSVMSRAIATPMVPVLSSHTRDGNWRAFREHYASRAILVAVLSACAVIGLVVIGEPVLAFLFHHKNFSEESVYSMWSIMLALSGMFMAGSIAQTLSSSFYASGNTRSPTKIGVVGYSIGIILKILGFYLYGVLGLAVATSSYYILNMVVLYFALKAHVESSVRNQERGPGYD